MPPSAASPPANPSGTASALGRRVALFVGTSGWAYTEWRGGFYPAGLPERRFLEHYSTTLDACEVNTTFYRVHTPETFARWRDATPDRFRFAVKAHRRLTHRKQIAPDAAWHAFHERFLGTLEPLGDRLTCILYQFPPYRERDDEGLGRLLEALPDHPPSALEFRDDSWHSQELIDRIGAAGATVCLSDQSGDVPDQLPPGPVAYVRLRSERYTEDQREGWRALLEREARRRDVFAFAKHRDVPAGDPLTGVGLAQWLVEQHGL
jgi:uncharacterized protein YecE (DUF72 family)